MMKYFTNKALRSYEGYESARKSYWEYIREIRSELPSALFNLHHHYSLHDATISSITEVHDSDLIFVLDGCRNCALAETDRVVFMLHFINAHYSKRSLNGFVQKDILYTEITRGDQRRWKFSALTTKEGRSDVIEIQFDDFGYYLHDYRVGA